MSLWKRLKLRWECLGWGHLDNRITRAASPRPEERYERLGFRCLHCGRELWTDDYVSRRGPVPLTPVARMPLPEPRV